MPSHSGEGIFLSPVGKPQALACVEIGENLNLREKTIIMEASQIDRTLTRIAHEILEKNNNLHDIVFLGIATRGVFLASRLVEEIMKIENYLPPVGCIDITLYRDDLNYRKINSKKEKTDIPCDVTDKVVILVDDVLFTGRSIRAAMDEIMDYGRPRLIQLAVLIDRGHRELPIRADYVGKNLPTSKRELVKVYLKEKDGIDRVIILETEE